ncbi:MULTISPECIES: hypothetical protein [unclassified Mesorhizobium]|uniref:hypothetical protein n=1 Tax=unclassified Mesorhizobium TaxID=325217 RepID=UPI00142F2522|nr:MULTISPECIES: hypothetical protein [unclassified Mesorhizobium]
MTTTETTIPLGKLVPSKSNVRRILFHCHLPRAVNVPDSDGAWPRPGGTRLR